MAILIDLLKSSFSQVEIRSRFSILWDSMTPMLWKCKCSLEVASEAISGEQELNDTTFSLKSTRLRLIFASSQMGSVTMLRDKHRNAGYCLRCSSLIYRLITINLGMIISIIRLMLCVTVDFSFISIQTLMMEYRYYLTAATGYKMSKTVFLHEMSRHTL